MWRNRHLLCHLFSCMVTKLLCHVRGSCSLFQELMWDTEKRAHPSTSILPAKDHSKYVYGTQLFVISPLVQFLSLFSAASCDSGKLCFPLRKNASGLALSCSIQWSLLCMRYPHCVLCHRWFSSLVLSSGTNKDYWRDCLEEGNEQKPYVLEGKINNRLAVIWKEVRPIRDTKFRIAAARVWTATKICLCHLQNAFPQNTNWVFALPTSWCLSLNTPFCFFVAFFFLI